MPAVHGDDMRGLAVFFSDIRNCKSKEEEIKRINKELANRVLEDHRTFCMENIEKIKDNVYFNKMEAEAITIPDDEPTQPKDIEQELDDEIKVKAKTTLFDIFESGLCPACLKPVERVHFFNSHSTMLEMLVKEDTPNLDNHVCQDCDIIFHEKKKPFLVPQVPILLFLCQRKL